MSVRVEKGLIEICSVRGIESYRSRSVRMPVALRKQQLESTGSGNSSTKILIAIQSVVGQRRVRVRWNPLGEGNQMV